MTHHFKTSTPVKRDDFTPKIPPLSRCLTIGDDYGWTRLTLRPDNPAANAVALLTVADYGDGADGCISMDYEATKALRDALTVLLDERNEDGSLR